MDELKSTLLFGAIVKKMLPRREVSTGMQKESKITGTFKLNVLHFEITICNILHFYAKIDNFDGFCYLSFYIHIVTLRFQE